MDFKKQDLKAINDYLLTFNGSDTDALLARAESGMNGMFTLPGTQGKPVFVGNPPKWSENNYGVGGFTWSLSRLGYMVTLCKAYLVTKDRRYLDKVEFDLSDWFEKEPPPPIPTENAGWVHYHGIHNWRMLELGNRMVHTFPSVLAILRTYSENSALVERIYQSIEEHAVRIYLGSHILWPNLDHNHYVEEQIGLLACAAMLPDHPDAGKWAESSMAGLEVSCKVSITEDGSQFEGAGLYHTAVACNYCYAIDFAKKCGKTFSEDFLSRVRNSLEFSVQTTSTVGGMLAYGDAHAHSTSSITAAFMNFLTFGDDRLLITLRQFISAERILRVIQSSAPWGFDNIPELLEWLAKPVPTDKPLLPLSTRQRQMDQYIVRTAWSREASCLYFACQSPINNDSNHAHMDQLGVIFASLGKELLIDPGCTDYKEGAERHFFKRSLSHCVPTVDGRDAFEYIHTFAYGPQKDGALSGVIETDRIKGAYGYHANYDPTILYRTAAIIDGKFLLIADTFEHVKGENMKIFFHLNTPNAIIDGSSVVTTDENDVNIRIVPSLGTDEITPELLVGRPTNFEGVYMYDYPYKRVSFSHTAENDTETVIFACVPFKDKSADDLKELKFSDGVITFKYCGEDYKIKYENGVFSF